MDEEKKIRWATESNVRILIGLIRDRLQDFLSEDEILDAINTSISNLTHLSFKKDDQLPETGETKFIYLVPNNEGEQSNLYSEYLWVEEDSTFELIGTVDTSKIDLSGYVTKEELNSKKYVSETEVEQKLEDYVLKDDLIPIEDTEIVSMWNEVMANLPDE